MHPNPRKIAPVFLLLVLTAASIYYLMAVSSAEANGPLVASGTVEAVEVNLAADLSGRVVEVLAGEGDLVESGQVLIRLDDSLLQAQLNQALAALDLARAQFDQVAAGQPPEQKAAAVAAAQAELVAARRAYDNIDDLWPAQATLAQQALKDARQRQYNAERRLGYLTTSADQTDIDLAYTALVLAEDVLERAKDAFEPWEDKPADNLQRAALQARMAEAQQTYDAAVRNYNALAGTANDFDVSQAQAELAIADAQLEQAQDDYDLLIQGPDPADLEMAQARITAAESALEAALAPSPTPEQLAIAQAQVDQAQAAVNLLHVQLDKTVIRAPSSGVVLERLVEPGELALPNASLLVISDLEALTLTVYAPEDRYGEIVLGQEVTVTVDSFPEQTFRAVVSHIADQAEFTPRNVQTQEGRRTTVFGIRLSLVENGGRLKPGMPADVVFSAR